jgi:hypothetical protein
MARPKPKKNYLKDDLERRLHGVTTPLYIDGNPEAEGTGFFYYVPAKSKPKKGLPVPTYKDVWLVTSKHVIFGEDGSLRPKRISFITRRIENWNKKVYKNDHEIDANYLRKELKAPADGDIDLVIIKVTDKIRQFHPPEKSLQDFGFFAMSESVLPDGPENVGQQVQSGDDVLIIGYPKGKLIEENFYPVIKPRCISSKWGANFGGKPYFIIDREVFSGSSGSPVISKPTNFVMVNGKLNLHFFKQYMFLGVYSGPASSDLAGTDSGMVCYSSIVRDLVLNRIPLTRHL